MGPALRKWAAVSLCGALACGGSTAANQVNGSLSGRSFSNPSAVVAQTTFEGQPATVVYLSDVPNLCAELQSGFEVKNANLLVLAAWVADANASGTPAVDAGTYVLNLYGTPPLNEGALEFRASDSSCSWAADELGDFGKIVFTTLSPTHATGTFTATVGTQSEHVSGSFDAPACDLSQPTTATCH